MDVLNSPDKCIYRVTKSSNKIRVQVCVGEYHIAVCEPESGWEDVTDPDIKSYVYEAMLVEGVPHTGRYDIW